MCCKWGKLWSEKIFVQRQLCENLKCGFFPLRIFALENFFTKGTVQKINCMKFQHTAILQLEYLQTTVTVLTNPVYRNSRNFRVTYFHAFNFRCNLFIIRGFKRVVKIFPVSHSFIWPCNLTRQQPLMSCCFKATPMPRPHSFPGKVHWFRSPFRNYSPRFRPTGSPGWQPALPWSCLPRTLPAHQAAWSLRIQSLLWISSSASLGWPGKTDKKDDHHHYSIIITSLLL